MNNLAGVSVTEADSAVLEELEAANVPAVHAASCNPRIGRPAEYMGILEWPQQRIDFIRLACNWCVGFYKPIHVRLMERISDEPGDFGSVSFRGTVKGRLGSVVLGSKFYGGYDPSEWDGPIDGWDVCTIPGLIKLVKILREHYGDPYIAART